VDKDVSELLRHIEYEQLAAFVTQYASQNASFKKNLLKYFSPQKPGKSLKEYREIAAGSFNFKQFGRYGKGYDFYAAASKANNELSGMLEKAKYFILQNNYKEAAAIAQSVIESIPRNYENVDDSDGDLGDTFKNAIALLLEIAVNKSIDTELIKEIFHWVGTEVKENIYSDYGFDEIHSLLIPYTLAAGLFKQALLIADERIEHAKKNEYRLDHAVNDKIRLLRQNKYHDEAESVITRYIDLVSIRKMRINEMLEQKRYPEAINLIEKGMKVSKKQGHSHTVRDWRDQLLEIYIVMADHNNTIKYAEDLFYNGSDAMKYYHILKKETDKEKWTTYLNMLILKRKPGRLVGYPDNVLAKIYIEEAYWDRLLHLVEDADLSGLQAYEQYLKPRFPEEVRNLFVHQVKLYAGRNVGRHYYQQVAETLRKMRTYPAGNEVVDKLLAEFRKKYKARPAMIEELRGV
jgi:hypothetical protein